VFKGLIHFNILTLSGRIPENEDEFLQ